MLRDTDLFSTNLHKLSARHFEWKHQRKVFWQRYVFLNLHWKCIFTKTALTYRKPNGNILTESKTEFHCRIGGVEFQFAVYKIDQNLVNKM